MLASLPPSNRLRGRLTTPTLAASLTKGKPSRDVRGCERREHDLTGVQDAALRQFARKSASVATALCDLLVLLCYFLGGYLSLVLGLSVVARCAGYPADWGRGDLRSALAIERLRLGGLVARAQNRERAAGGTLPRLWSSARYRLRNRSLLRGAKPLTPRRVPARAWCLGMSRVGIFRCSRGTTASPTSGSSPPAHSWMMPTIGSAVRDLCSIDGLLNHILVGDRRWMALFEQGDRATPPLDPGNSLRRPVQPA